MKEEFGVDSLTEPERFAVFIDHMVPAASPKEEELHIQTRKWCKENSVALYERKGIGHQVAPKSAMRCLAPSWCISTAMSASSALSARSRWASGATSSKPSCVSASR